MDIVQVGNVLLSIDCFREMFACDLAICRGCCCVEGDAGAPITPDEILSIEEILPNIEKDLSQEALSVIKSQGIAYTDADGELVTSIVHGKNCVFTVYDDKGTCLCAIECAQRGGRTTTAKPFSCRLYPFRVKKFDGGLWGVNYHRWNICRCGREKGVRLKLPVYKFLKKPLVDFFGKDWYAQLEETARQIEINE